MSLRISATDGGFVDLDAQPWAYRAFDMPVDERENGRLDEVVEKIISDVVVDAQARM